MHNYVYVYIYIYGFLLRGAGHLALRLAHEDGGPAHEAEAEAQLHLVPGLELHPSYFGDADNVDNNSV